MKPELLIQGNDLTRRINTLKEHLIKVRTEQEDAYEGDKAGLYIENNFQRGSIPLELSLLPITLPEYMAMYIARVEKEIKILEKQFEKL